MKPSPSSPSSASSGSNCGRRISSVVLSIASPEKIRSWSGGEVRSGDTLIFDKNKGYKPVEDGLYCEKIFGRIDRHRIFGQIEDWEAADWQCSCGTYKGIEHRGIKCKQCEFEVTLPQVRRELMGHIELAVPVCHVWFLKNQPSVIGQFLGVSTPKLETVADYNGYIVLDPEFTDLETNQFLTEKEYLTACETYGPDAFDARTGGEGIREALKMVNLKEKQGEIRLALTETKNLNERKKLVQRLQILEAFEVNKIRPEWMVLTVLPVLPPGLRVLIPMGNKKNNKVAFSTNDFNDLYRRIINRNERLKEIIKQNLAGKQIIQSEKRLLQRSVNALFANGRHGIRATNLRRELLKPLVSQFEGKKGLFRQNLLGKRVDFSARTVITVGPNLKLHQCGLPKHIALVLFEPFIICQLLKQGIVNTQKEARDWIKNRPAEVWEILESILRGRLVLLNRQPTLHRLSIQAFEPILVEGETIRLHPLVCQGYNADFDGDQVAVHLPISDQTQTEARKLMMSQNNILSPASGKPIIMPTQDIVLGCYYLTAEPRKPKPNDPNTLPVFGSKEEALMVSDYWAIKGRNRASITHDRIRLANPDFGRTTAFGDADSKFINTTIGRVLFNDIWPSELGFINGPVRKSELSELIDICLKICGQSKTVATLERLKEVGLQEATRAGISIGIDDMLIPAEKEAAIDVARAELTKVKLSYDEDRISEENRKLEGNKIWQGCTDQISKAMIESLEVNPGKDHHNPLWLMLESGARGNKDQVRQLGGLRGLMSKPNGETIEIPILSNFREGLKPFEFFISSHGARKGMSDTALMTAKAGYLTRKLVYAVQDVIINQEDCGTTNGVLVQVSEQGGKGSVSQLVGSVAAADIMDPCDSGKILVAISQEISESTAEALALGAGKQIKIRSILTCESKRGVCIRCYGRNLSTGKLVELGEAVGIIAAQSIGEPGTQMTMRTFHTGGIASAKGDITAGLPKVEAILEARSPIPPENIVESVQAIYREHKAEVHRKHIEIIVRQMLGKVQITKSGSSRFMRGDEVSQVDFLQENQQILNKGGQPAEAKQIVYGITKLAKQTEGFLGAASFQEAAQTLFKAAILSKRDDMLGIKEKVMTGGIIPVGTGFKA